MSKTKVILRVPTLNAAAGETVEVDKDTADFLTANGHGVRASEAPAEAKGDKK